MIRVDWQIARSEFFSDMAKIERALLSVFDKTGLEATFRFEFHIPPRQSGDADSPSIFTAVQEQLGLQLESAKVPSDAFVIEANKPDSVDFEGYLFPDTYRFFVNATADDIVQKLLREMDEKFTSDMRDTAASKRREIGF